jgi:hypothetical protein
MPLNDQLLREYVNTFYGYGNYGGDWWLVGMEEGGGNTVEEVATRLRLWNERGQKELEDLDMFSSSPALAKWFTPRPPLQATWRGLIRLILSAEGRSTDPETARVYQGTQLGRAGGNNCILELLPLPSQSVGHWIYGAHSALPELRNRETYLERIIPGRVAHQRNRIREHRPKAVIFYSRNYQPWWEQITGVSFGAPIAPGLHVIKQEHTLFAMTMQPTYRGVTTQYFIQAGAAIGELARGAV